MKVLEQASPLFRLGDFSNFRQWLATGAVVAIRRVLYV